MLFSIALAPGILNPPAAPTPDRIRDLTSVLDAISQNGVFVSPDSAALRADLARLALSAIGRSAQRFQVLAADVPKDTRHHAVSPSFPAEGSGPLARCIRAAKWGLCDAVLVVDEAERRAAIDAGVSRERVLLLEEFPGSVLDVQRQTWREAQRLDTLADPVALGLVGGAVRYAKALVVADKMIGVAAKDGSTKVEKHLRGVKYLADAWNHASPHASLLPLEVEIVTVAGGTGARKGYVDPTAARTVITAAMNAVDPHRRIGNLKITLKQDGEPQVFNDRLLICGGRAWGIQHGLDDLGKLSRPGTRRPTMIDPPSHARATVFRDIQALKDL